MIKTQIRKKTGRVFLLALLSVNFIPLFSAIEVYPVSEIPATLKENAHTVYRVYKSEVEYKSDKLVIENITEAITILNDNGESSAYFKVFINSMRNLQSFSGKVYDALGRKVKSLSSEDIVNQSYIDGGSLYTDNRIKYLDPKYKTFPFTVEYTYTIEHKQTLFFPSWYLYNLNVSYQNALCSVKVPAGFKLNYKEYNLPIKLTKTTEGKSDIYSISMENLPAAKNEIFSDYTKPDYPLIMFSTEDFTMKGTKGSLKSWSDFGIWVTGLNEGKDVLPETTVAKIKEMTASCATDIEKIQKVYEFMQQKTRYVSIQIGIGGYEPYDAATVDKTSYGDCKALSNYTKALLDVAGVKSYYCLIKAGEDAMNIDTNFPGSQFNHAVVCVPTKNDTLWLECTSQRMPFGFIGDFTDNRNALLIDGEKSKLVKTQKYSADENCIARDFVIRFTDIESGEATLNSIYKGLRYEDIIPIYYADNKQKEKMVLQKIKLPTFSLINFDYTEHKKIIPAFEEKININFSNYIRRLNENILILPLNFLNSTAQVPEKSRQRKSDIFVRRASKETNKYTFHLPEGYLVTGKPENKTIETKFGTYSNKILVEKNTVVFEREFQLNDGRFPVSEYNDFREFAEQVVAADAAMIQLGKK